MSRTCTKCKNEITDDEEERVKESWKQGIAEVALGEAELSVVLLNCIVKEG